jgi:hypothetical protein
MSQEFQRLHDYSDPKKSPFLFPKSVAFATDQNSFEVAQASWKRVQGVLSQPFEHMKNAMNNDHQAAMGCLAPSIKESWQS